MDKNIVYKTRECDFIRYGVINQDGCYCVVRIESNKSEKVSY